MDTAIIVQLIMDVTVIWIVALHVLNIGAVVAIKQWIHVIIAITNVLLLVIYVLVVAMIAMMYLVGVVGLLVVM